MSVIKEIYYFIYGIGMVLAEIDTREYLDLKDFSQIITKDFFIDKTLMIKDFLNGPKVISITTPRRFGKTTNLNMLHRFLNTEVDDYGKPKDPKQTFNYKLFAENNTKIFQEKDFFQTHFGKYPVLFVNYSPLDIVTNFEIMLNHFCDVLEFAFKPHAYLLENPKLFTEKLTEEKIRRFVHPEYHLGLDESEVKVGLSTILELLYRHFDKKVIVIMDNYDSYIESLMLTNSPDREKIKLFVDSITSEFFSNKCIDRILISGVMRAYGAIKDVQVTDYYFLGDHPLAKYFGLTSGELELLQNEILKSEKTPEEENKIIEEYYNGYSVINQNIKMYNPWSVLNFLYGGKKITYYRRKYGFVPPLRFICSFPEIYNLIENLLSGKEFEVDLTKSFSNEDFTALNGLVRTGKADNDKIKEVVLRYFYQLGYFGLNTLGKKGDSRTSVKIANEEVKVILREYITNDPDE